VETASFLRTFGFDVTLMVRADLLRELDQEMVRLVKTSMTNAGIIIETVTPTSLLKVGNNKWLVMNSGGQSTVFNKVSFCVGQMANSEGLGLESCGVSTNQGKIVIDNDFRTSVRNIFAVGDVTNMPPLKSAAIKSGKFVAGIVNGTKQEQRPCIDNLPTTVHATIEYSRIGVSEKSARLENENLLSVYRAYRTYTPVENMRSK
jgi:pyruvate/2-oxoglutarate dehydrogenase complex dihydrolipoamide dehydrogenase (E3) component